MATLWLASRYQRCLHTLLCVFSSWKSIVTFWLPKKVLFSVWLYYLLIQIWSLPAPKIQDGDGQNANSGIHKPTGDFTVATSIMFYSLWSIHEKNNIIYNNNIIITRMIPEQQHWTWEALRRSEWFWFPKLHETCHHLRYFWGYWGTPQVIINSVNVMIMLLCVCWMFANMLATATL